MPLRSLEAGHRQRPSPASGWGRWQLLAVLTMLALLLAGAAALEAWRRARSERAALDSLQARIAAIQPAPPDARSEPCAEWRAQQPLVLLVLGQSNAANHGEAGMPPPPPLRVVHEGRCLWASDPLPGGTGEGGSIWARLPPRLAAQLPEPMRARPVVLALLAVDATPLRDWVRADSPLRARLLQTATALRASGLAPDLVLWQQGEADARDNTLPLQAATALNDFADLLADTGIGAPWMLAQSTLCRSPPHAALRETVQRQTAAGRRFVPGPDTDQLSGATMRRDGCHFSAAGLNAAADLWAAALAAYFVRN